MSLLPAVGLANADGPRRVTIQRGVLGEVNDCYIWSSSPGTNGNSSLLYTGLVGAGDKAALLRFELGGEIPANAVVLEARVLLDNTGGGNQAVSVHRVTKAWLEAEPVWTTFDDAFDARVVSTYEATLGRNVFDVTPAVRDWVNGTSPNHGLMLWQALGTASSTYVSSNDANVARRPALEVWFEVPGALVQSTPSATLEAACGVELRYPLNAHAPEATAYSMKGPDGLEVDAVSGELTWTPTRGQAGSHALTAVVARGAERGELPVTVEVTCNGPMTVGCTAAPAGLGLGWVAAAVCLRRRRRRA